MQGSLSPTQTSVEPSRITGRQAWIEVILLWVLMFLHGGEIPPGVNEAHYLVKAKGVWDAQWCPNDLFVTSGKAHLLFDATFGWLTTQFSLTATAWIGRAIGWGLLSWSLALVVWRLAPFRFATLWVGLLWMVGVDGGNLAGEWIVGGIEAKVPAYALLLFALHQWFGDRPWMAWPFLGFAAAFHVLVGGWGVIAFLIGASMEPAMRASWRSHLLPLLFGGCVSLIGLIPALQLNAEATPEVSLQAARIYSYQRISHHLYAPAFATSWYIRFGSVTLISALFAWLARHHPSSRRWTGIAGGAMALAVVGLGLGWLASVAPDLAARLLRFYWFRLSDALIPLWGALSLAMWVALEQRTVAPRSPWNGIRGDKRLPVGSVTCLIGLVCLSGVWEWRRWQSRMELPAPGACRQSLLALQETASADRKNEILRDWIAMCEWVADNTPEDAVFLSPRYQQTFKWFSGRSEVVNWKDVPQDARSLVEWSRRMSDVFPARLGGSRVSIQAQELKRFREIYGAKYVINDRRIVLGNLPLLKLYPGDNDSNATFEVYAIQEHESQ